MMPDRSTLIGNIVEYCKRSPKRVAILNAVRKPKNYREVAVLVNADETYCSDTLNRMSALGAVEAVPAKKGHFRQTQLMRTIDLSAELRRSDVAPTTKRMDEAEIVKEVVRILDLEKAADLLDLEPAIRSDCFPPKQPYRKDVGEAYLTLEVFLRTELNLPQALVGVKLVNEAALKGLFNRDVEAEKNSLIELYHGAFGWLRNTAHHYKDDVSKLDAIKMILFADHLIKLIRRLKEENMTPESRPVSNG